MTRKMINFDDITKKDAKVHNSNWPKILDYPYRVLIAGGSESGKSKALLNLITHKPDGNNFVKC